MLMPPAQSRKDHGSEPAQRVKIAIGVVTFVLGLLTVVAPLIIIPACQHQPPPDKPVKLMEPLVRASRCLSCIVVVARV